MSTTFHKNANKKRSRPSARLPVRSAAKAGSEAKAGNKTTSTFTFKQLVYPILFPNFAPEMKFLNHILRLPYFSTYYISNTCSDRLYTYVKLI